MINIEKISTQVEYIKEAILNSVRVDEMYLFGSYAYGNPSKDSDIDIYVVIPDDEIRPIDVMCKIALATSSMKSTPIDFLVSKSSVFNQRKSLPGIERIVAQNGVKIYEQH